jgi:cytochrome c biogenesis protein CcmG/thiol:disulfide interchange protein DsbE
VVLPGRSPLTEPAVDGACAGIATIGHVRDEASGPDQDRRGRDRGRIAAAIGVGVAVVLVLVFLIVGLANRGTGTSIREALARGERPQAPDLALPVLSAGGDVGPAGSETSLSDVRGRVVLVNVWASWCIPCEDEAPVLETLWRDYRDRDVLVLGIDVRDLSSDATAFIRRERLSYPSLRDGDGNDTEDGFETSGVPETFLLDREGKIAYRHLGPLVLAADVVQFRRVLESVL